MNPLEHAPDNKLKQRKDKTTTTALPTDPPPLLQDLASSPEGVPIKGPKAPQTKENIRLQGEEDWKKTHLPISPIISRSAYPVSWIYASGYGVEGMEVEEGRISEKKGKG